MQSERYIKPNILYKQAIVEKDLWFHFSMAAKQFHNMDQKRIFFAPNSVVVRFLITLFLVDHGPQSDCMVHFYTCMSLITADFIG